MSPAPSGEPLIELRDLCKIYEPSPRWMRLFVKSAITSEIRAVDRISLTVWPGEIFAIVGPNGAGKSTLFRLLTGLITPTSGSVRVAGVDVVGDARRVRREIGFMPADDRSLYLRNTCWQNLVFHGRLHGLTGDELRDRVDTTLEVVGLSHMRDRVGHALSSGMRARLQLGRALMHQPRVLILDEPTSTIDPLSAHELLTLIRKLASEHEMAVLLSSHRLEEIDALQDNVLFLNGGAAVHTGSIESLRDAIERPLLLLKFGDGSQARLAADHLAMTDGLLRVDVCEATLTVHAESAPGEVLRKLGPHLESLVGVDRTRMPLQELIAQLMHSGPVPR